MESGKTLSMIDRLPAFYEADQMESLLFQLLNVFGQLMEQTEIDLFRVMRSHYVSTADNEGSQGFGTSQQGDLDKIFSLYLEVLGGTSQLTQINPKFRPDTFKDVPGLITKLQTSQDLVSRSLLQGFSAAHREHLTQQQPLTENQIQSVKAILTEEFNRCLQDPFFYQHNRAAFAINALTPITRQLVQRSPARGRDLEILNRSLLETAYPNDLEKSDAPYRERLLALIRVLRRGAATKQGICDIVAANLGIFSDDPAAQAAKEQIKIEEYLPELVSHSVRIHPFSPEPTLPIPTELTLAQTFQIDNPNVVPTAPGIKIEVQDARRQTASTLPLLQPLVNPRLINLDTQASFEFRGMLKVNDVLRVLPDGKLFLNGVEIPAQSPPPFLPLETCQWRIEARVGEAEGRFDQTLFELSRYDQVEVEPVPLNRQQAINYAIALTFELTKITPGSFRVRIPWNIPGFTDKFGELGDHPRTQIPAIIDQVKAAGVLAVIDYEQAWTETHTLMARLTVVRSPFEEIHAIAEGNFDIGSYQNLQGVPHEMSDQLLLNGVFDYTTFDSINSFAN